MSPDTYVILRGRGDLFTFEYRGPIEIKVSQIIYCNLLVNYFELEHVSAMLL